VIVVGRLRKGMLEAFPNAKYGAVAKKYANWHTHLANLPTTELPRM